MLNPVIYLHFSLGFDIVSAVLPGVFPSEIKDGDSRPKITHACDPRVEFII